MSPQYFVIFRKAPKLFQKKILLFWLILLRIIQKDLTRFNKKRPRWQVDKEAIVLWRVQPFLYVKPAFPRYV